MSPSLLLLLPLFLLSSEFQINWLSNQRNSVRIQVQADQTDFVRACVRNELKVRFRFEVQLCKRRKWWLNACHDPRAYVNSMEYDPITESYVVSQNAHFDGGETRVRRYNSLEEAVAVLATIPEVRLADLLSPDAGLLRSSRLVMAARLVADCRGNYNKIFADISSFLTFGLIRISGFDTGRVGFDLESQGLE